MPYLPHRVTSSGHVGDPKGNNFGRTVYSRRRCYGFNILWVRGGALSLGSGTRNKSLGCMGFMVQSMAKTHLSVTILIKLA